MSEIIFWTLICTPGVLLLAGLMVGWLGKGNAGAYVPPPQASKSAEDDDDSTWRAGSLDDDDSPARGLWDPTSIYYDHSRDDD